ncbi:MepB family protein [Soonwooa sp.]|uniref:MepB family protein n=1 Tax=Soonwooa sp. TaxID=1938592 RepID=UPI00260A5526|nr:MepB family protein [Soonwooa sp.]
MKIEILNRLEKEVFEKIGYKISDLEQDNECEEYLGYNFRVKDFNIKFRKAKVTPKKVGQFVTLWKRNPQGETEAFNTNDDFDFYIIASESENRFGIFLFPKLALVKNKILSTENAEGKRGFRLYPVWDLPTNKQAEKTKLWQSEFFVNFADSKDKILNQINRIFDFK